MQLLGGRLTTAVRDAFGDGVAIQVLLESVHHSKVGIMLGLHLVALLIFGMHVQEHPIAFFANSFTSFLRILEIGIDDLQVKARVAKVAKVAKADAKPPSHDKSHVVPTPLWSSMM